MKTINHNEFWSGVVWMVSGISLTLYAVLVLTGQPVPGMEDLVDMLSALESDQLYVIAFGVILIESIYVLGSFFPGSGAVVMLAILSGYDGFATFLLTILAIWLGWSLAGAINIFGAHLFQRWRKVDPDTTYILKDRTWIAWLPSMRANYEVAQVVEGGSPHAVFRSSLRVKFLISLAMLVITYLTSLVIDLQELSDDEGLGILTLFILASFYIGYMKIKKSKTSQ